MRRGSRQTSPLVWLLGVLIIGLTAYAVAVAAVGAAIVPGQSTGEKRAASYSELRADVEQAITDFLTVDYKRIKELTAKVKEQATGQFAEDYAANEVNLQAAATQAEAQTTGEVKSIGISDISDEGATVFVAADSVVKNKTTAKEKKTKACPHEGKVCRYYRFKLTMTDTGGSWKIAQLEFVS